LSLCFRTAWDWEHGEVGQLSENLAGLLSQGHHLRIEGCSNLENLSLRENEISDASSLSDSTNWDG